MSIFPCTVQFLHLTVMPCGKNGARRVVLSTPGKLGGRMAVSKYCLFMLASNTLVLVGDDDGGGGKTTDEVIVEDAVEDDAACRFRR